MRTNKVFTVCTQVFGTSAYQPQKSFNCPVKAKAYAKFLADNGWGIIRIYRGANDYKYVQK